MRSVSAVGAIILNHLEPALLETRCHSPTIRFDPIQLGRPVVDVSDGGRFLAPSMTRQIGRSVQSGRSRPSRTTLCPAPILGCRILASRPPLRNRHPPPLVGLRWPRSPRKDSRESLQPTTRRQCRRPQPCVARPMTRLRSGADGVPGPIVAKYYAQRAGIGLLVTEGVFPSAESRAYPGQPGIVTEAQAAGWAKVADAVHAEGGVVFMQLMNGGRVTHTDITGTDRIVAPSAIAIEGDTRLADGTKVAYPVPHALETEELATVRDEFVAAARKAVDAGLDGVELHSANGYLLTSSSPRLQPAHRRIYGGSPTPAPASSSRSPAPSSPRSEPIASASASRPPTTSRTCGRRTRPRPAPPTRRSCRASLPWALRT